MNHSYEELRKVALDILAGREKATWEPTQYEHLKRSVSDALETRRTGTRTGNSNLSTGDSELFLELFWDLFRQGIITLGLDDNNREFPFCRVTSFGRNLLSGKDSYFFHDLASYEKVIAETIPDIDSVTLVYLKEAMQAFMSGCLLSSSVMLGVATEHTFLKLMEVIDKNSTYRPIFQKASTEWGILRKVNKFKTILEQNMKAVPSHVREDLDTNFNSILSMIRNFRNESGHPSGKIISREQTYVLLQIFIPCCQKMYQLMEVFK